LAQVVPAVDEIRGAASSTGKRQTEKRPAFLAFDDERVAHWA
jgi:hypothetical protein